MRRYIFLWMILVAINGAAQVNNQDLIHKVDSLQQQVAQLTYNYHYLDCAHKLDVLSLNLNDYINGMKNSVDRLLINVYNNNYNAELYKGAKMECEVSDEQLTSYKTHFFILKRGVSIDAEAYGFTEHDLKLLEDRCNVIEAAIKSAEVSLGMYKDMVAAMKEFF